MVDEDSASNSAQDRWLSDLESQFAHAVHTDRMEQANELERAERTTLGLEDRLARTIGESLTLMCASGVALEGELRDVGRGWCELIQRQSGSVLLVNLERTLWLRGLSMRVRTIDTARPRLPFRVALERMMEKSLPVRISVGAREVSGKIVRVWADHVDVLTEDSNMLAHSNPQARAGMAVPIAGIEMVRIGL